MMSRAAKLGQFVVVMSHEHRDRIPLTIAGSNVGRGTITLVIQAVGKTTQEMQRTCRVGDRLFGIVGPMGVPSPIGDAASRFRIANFQPSPCFVVGHPV